MIPQGEIFSARDPNIWKKFIAEVPNIYFKEVRIDCEGRGPFHALIKLIGRAKSLKIKNAKLGEYPLYFDKVERLSIERLPHDKDLQVERFKLATRIKSFKIKIVQKLDL